MLGIKDINAYPKDTKIVDFGMDSLLTVEILHHAEQDLNAHLTVDDLRSMTLAELLELTKEDGKTFVKAVKKEDTNEEVKIEDNADDKDEK